MASSREIAVLEAGIDKLPENVMRALLKDLCRTSTTARKGTKAVVLEMIATQQSQETLAKRKAVETCMTCGEQYAEEQNHRSACAYHPGVKEVDWSHDLWADDDPDVHDVREFVEQEEYLEGTKWSCCKRQGPDLGCRKRMHQAGVSQARKK